MLGDIPGIVGYKGMPTKPLLDGYVDSGFLGNKPLPETHFFFYLALACFPSKPFNYSMHVYYVAHITEVITSSRGSED